MSAEPMPDDGEAGGHLLPEASSLHVVKNSLIYMVGQCVSWVVAFISVSLIPRRLGEVGIGQMAVAATAVGTVGSLLTLSLEQFLTPEASRDPRRIGRLLRATLGLRLVTFPVLILAACIALAVMKADPTVWRLGLLYMILNAFLYVYMPMRAILVGQGDAYTVSLCDLGQTGAPLLALPALPFGVIPMTTAMLAANFPMMAWAVLMVRRRVGGLCPIFDVALWRSMVRSSLGFMVNVWATPITLFTTVYLLKRYGGGESAVGVYSQSQKLLGTFLFIPTAIGTALLPSLTRLADASRDEFRRLQQRVTVALLVMGMPIMVLAFLLADPFCQLLYGKAQFQTLPITLKFCGLSVMPLYVTIIQYRFLIAERKNAIWGRFMLFNVALNILLCRILIPLTLHAPGIHAPTVGATVSFTLAETCSMGMAFLLLKVNPFNRETLARLARAVLAALAMTGVMWLCRDVFFVLRGVLGVAVFGTLAWRLGALGREDQAKIGDMARKSFRPLLSKFRRNR